VLIFTKADKQSRVKTDQNVSAFKKALSNIFEDMPTIFITSAELQAGKEEVLNFVGSINNQYDYKHAAALYGGKKDE
jgi:GTP-binding protein